MVQPYRPDRRRAPAAAAAAVRLGLVHPLMGDLVSARVTRDPPAPARTARVRDGGRMYPRPTECETITRSWGCVGAARKACAKRARSSRTVPPHGTERRTGAGGLFHVERFIKFDTVWNLELTQKVGLSVHRFRLRVSGSATAS